MLLKSKRLLPAARLVLLLCTGASGTAGDTAIATGAPFETGGCIYFTNTARETVQLTYSGKDRAPTLSPDGQHVAFIRKSKNQAYLSCGADEDEDGPIDKILADQIWILDTGTGKERLLVADRMPRKDSTRELERTIAIVDDGSLCFSPNSGTLYFISSAWVVSGALHAVDLRTRRQRFVAAANSVEVVPTGRYAGHLIIQQHKYFLGCGSYDWYWLIDPKGLEIGPVGDDLGRVNTFKQVHR